jgi:hypothetical protein
MAKSFEVVRVSKIAGFFLRFLNLICLIGCQKIDRSPFIQGEVTLR